MIQQFTALSNIDKAVIPVKVPFAVILLDLESFAKPGKLGRPDRFGGLGEPGRSDRLAGTK